MKMNLVGKLAIIAGCCVPLGSYLTAAPGGSGSHGGGGQSSSPGNSAFGHSQSGIPQTGSVNAQYGRATAAAAQSTSSTDKETTDDPDLHRKKSKKTKSKKTVKRDTAPGNSAFGRKQGDADTRTTGRQNSRFGRATAKAAKERHNNPRPTASASSSPAISSNGAPGNSDFGHKQGDAATRTTGEQNSQFGRATAEQAQEGKPGATATPAP
jgi:hypothetical protein